MERAGPATVALAEPSFRNVRRVIESVPEDLGLAMRLLRLDPRPGRMDDRQIPAECGCGSLVDVRRSGGIDAERLVRARPENMRARSK